mmetsp:Transcript_28735/g.82911  ORF Transcript_28735/g.82911 Transcript_28735/m.82911 type:complete len:219 (+) Transcript_28735:840-1496(+)
MNPSVVCIIYMYTPHWSTVRVKEGRRTHRHPRLPTHPHTPRPTHSCMQTGLISRAAWPCNQEPAADVCAHRIIRVDVEHNTNAPTRWKSGLTHSRAPTRLRRGRHLRQSLTSQTTSAPRPMSYPAMVWLSFSCLSPKMRHWFSMGPPPLSLISALPLAMVSVGHTSNGIHEGRPHPRRSTTWSVLSFSMLQSDTVRLSSSCLHWKMRRCSSMGMPSLA